MQAIYLGSKHQLRHLQALFPCMCTRPISDMWEKGLALCHSQIKKQDEPELANITCHKFMQITENQRNDPGRH